MNLYGFVDNNPSDRIDPLGLSATTNPFVPSPLKKFEALMAAGKFAEAAEFAEIMGWSALAAAALVAAEEGAGDDAEDDDSDEIPYPRVDEKPKKGWYWCDARCDVHPTPYIYYDENNKKCKGEPSDNCPLHTEGSGIGKTLPEAKKNAKNNAQKAIQGHLGCRTRHCHTLRCKKI